MQGLYTKDMWRKPIHGNIFKGQSKYSRNHTRIRDRGFKEGELMLTVFSYFIAKIRKEDKIKALEIIKENNIPFKKANLNSSSSLIIAFPLSKQKIISQIFKNNGISADFSIKKGFTFFIASNKHRLGLLIGAFLLILSIKISQNFVWRIEIEGNEAVSKDEILATLSGVGFDLGSYIPSIDYDDLHNKILLKNKNLSWISINIKGNVATVLVRESLSEEQLSEPKYSNMIASQDGHIALVTLIDGKKHVSIGDVVSKGDLLISGILDSQSQGVRYTEAKGNVYAYVNKEISIEIPYENSQKQYTGTIYSQKIANFFSKDLFLYKNNNKSEILCDIMEESKFITLFKTIKLPIRIKTKEFYEYETITVTYSRDEATVLAYNQLSKELESLRSASDIISKNVNIKYTDKGVSLVCKLYCLENIAVPLEYYVE